MKDQLISFETAKLAREVGFDELCITWFDRNGRSEEYTTLGKNSQSMIAFYSRPTQSLLQKWLREVHKIDMTIHCQLHTTGIRYESEIYYEEDLYNEPYCNVSTWFDTYEGAVEDGLQDGCKVVKSKK